MSTPVAFNRVRHAAHYIGSGGSKGHDLETWNYAQATRLPVPAGVPADAEYHSGYRGPGDTQWWVYVRRAPLSGNPCAMCGTGKETGIIGVENLS